MADKAKSEDFPPGTVVRLKSGGAPMTVADNRILSTGKLLVRCVWMDEKQFLHSDEIEQVYLKKCEAL